MPIFTASAWPFTPPPETVAITLNVPAVSLVASGDFAEPRCASHGGSWWEFDHSYLTIRAFELVGLASNLAKPKLRNTLDNPAD